MRYAILGACLALAWAPAAYGQIFEVTAGQSNTYNSSGATLRMQQDRLNTFASGGWADGLRLGGGADREFSPRLIMHAGDSARPFVLPTDIFDASHVLLRRGVGVTGQTEHASWDIFAGAGASNSITPYLGYATADHALGMAFLQYSPTRQLVTNTYLLTLGQTTAIESLAWQPRPTLKLALGGGLGSDHPFAAAALDWEHPNWGAKLSYTGEDGHFRRLEIDPTQASEVVGWNGQLWRQWSWLHLDGSHRTYEGVPQLPTQQTRGVIDEAGAELSHFGVSASARIYRAEAAGQRSSYSLYSFTPRYRRWRSVESYTRGTIASGQKVSSLLSMQYYQLLRSLELEATASSSGSTRNISLGGTLSTNKVDFSLAQQQYLVPLALQHQLQQVWIVSLQIHAFGNVSIHLDNQLGNDGHLHYTAYADDYLYHDSGLWLSSQSAGFKKPKYSVEGYVATRSGEPLAGAAVMIGKAEVYTDRNGFFSYGMPHKGRTLVQIKIEDFLAPGCFGHPVPPQAVEVDASRPSAQLRLMLDRLPAGCGAPDVPNHESG